MQNCHRCMPAGAWIKPGTKEYLSGFTPKIQCTLCVDKEGVVSGNQLIE